MSYATSFGLVAMWFDKIINKEMDRGGEEYGERATTQIQKRASIVFVSAIVIIVLVVVMKILTAFDLIHFGI